jgi:hypothetical protein
VNNEVGPYDARTPAESSPFDHTGSKVKSQQLQQSARGGDSIFTPVEDQDLQKAIFELQDVKNNYYKEQKDFEDK